LLFAVIAVPWYAVIFMKEGTAFFAGFFLRSSDRFGGLCRQRRQPGLLLRSCWRDAALPALGPGAALA
jgi:hypothetical protein